MPKVLSKEEYTDRALADFVKTKKREIKARVAEIVAEAKAGGDKPGAAAAKSIGADVIRILTETEAAE